MTTPSDEMIRELCLLVTRDDAGRHFTTTSQWYQEMESLGLVAIDRPVHESTGISYDSHAWTIAVTEDGLALVAAHPELHPE